MNMNTSPQYHSQEEVYGLDETQAFHLREAIEKEHKQQINQICKTLHAADIADFIQTLSPDRRKIFLQLLDKTIMPEVLIESDENIKEDVVNLLGLQESAQAISSMQTDDAIDVIENLDEQGQQEILETISKKRRAELEEGLAHPLDSAGRLAERKIVSVPEFWTIGQTIDFLRSADHLPENFYQVVVVDPKLRPKGAVLLAKIMCNPRHVAIRDIMEKKLRLIRAEMDQEEVAFIFRQYGLISAPVVNHEGRMIGTITLDDVIHVIDEEAQEDIMHLGGVNKADLYTGLIKTMTRRFPWLMMNLITALLASIVVAAFEAEIARLAALAVLMPIIASMGGNAGTQTLTVAVRGIATKELTTTNALRVIMKEMAVGSLNGVVFAVIAGMIVYVWYGQLLLSILFAGATMITLLLAGLFGACIPVMLTKLKIDPALASGVVLTTVTDIVGFGAFLGLAAFFLL